MREVINSCCTQVPVPNPQELGLSSVTLRKVISFLFVRRIFQYLHLWPVWHLAFLVEPMAICTDNHDATPIWQHHTEGLYPEIAILMWF